MLHDLAQKLQDFGARNVGFCLCASFRCLVIFVRDAHLEPG